jgi:hypothetical protein
MNRWRAVLALALVVLGCSASSATTEPNVDSSKRLVALSSPEQEVLCDWLAQREGGYGRTIVCDASGAPLESSLNQAQCLAESRTQAERFPNCPTTVGQWKTCAEWFLGHWCSVMAFSLPPDCAEFQDQCFPSATNSGIYLDGGGYDAAFPPCSSGPLPEDAGPCSVPGAPPAPRD